LGVIVFFFYKWLHSQTMAIVMAVGLSGLYILERFLCNKEQLLIKKVFINCLIFTLLINISAIQTNNAVMFVSVNVIGGVCTLGLLMASRCTKL